MEGKIEDVMKLGTPAFKCDEVVNMQDVTGLNRVGFTDVLDLGKSQNCAIKPRQGKMVNFLDKFGDSGTIPETETWDVCLPNVQDEHYLKIKNK